MVKISVIIPVFKVPEKYIRECFDSLIAQTLLECEFIVVSDGAPEKENTICKEYVKKDPRFKFFKRNHEGVSSTRNFGIDQASGEYITFVDSDDWIDKDTLGRAYENIIRNKSQMLIWNLSFFDEKKNCIGTTSLNKITISAKKLIDKASFQKQIIWAQNKEDLIPALTVCKLISKQLIDSFHIRFDETVEFGEDRLFNYNLSLYLNQISSLNKSMYGYRQHSSSTMHKIQTHAFDKHIAYIEKLSSLSQHNHPVEIANETINSFYGCLIKINQSNIKFNEYLDEMNHLKSFIKSKKFSKQIQPSTIFFEGNVVQNIEVKLMKQNCTFFFSLRILKQKIIHFFRS